MYTHSKYIETFKEKKKKRDSASNLARKEGPVTQKDLSLRQTWATKETAFKSSNKHFAHFCP